jgi:hypothetical protein
MSFEMVFATYRVDPSGVRASPDGPVPTGSSPVTSPAVRSTIETEFDQRLLT